MIKDDFLNFIASKLSSDGICHIITDWQDYSSWIEEKLHNRTDFILLDNDKTRSMLEIETKYQKRGHGLGHEDYHFYLMVR